MKHYETLGVTKDATADQIKRAYRARAKTAHPDRGGQQSDFEPIVHAYEVLKDPARRLLYDSTGQDKQTPIAAAVQTTLLQLFNQALALPEDISVVKTVKKALEDGISKMENNIDNLEARKIGLEAKRSKIKTKKGVQNFVHLVVDDQIMKIAGQIANQKHEIEVGKAALETLKSYKEEWEKPERTVIIYNGATFRSSASTTTYE